ncbi:MAG: hypothetical protein F6K30_06455 [Cyanothece sp. SIO2G6]|nr:hypothetical protein [Cyanothece sp. SIO2G6]
MIMRVKARNIKSSFWAIAAIASLFTGVASVAGLNPVRVLASEWGHTIADANHHSMPSAHDGHESHSSPGHGNANHDHGGANHGHAGHHGSLDVMDPERVPAVTLIVQPDSRSGWNVEVQTENFTFAPERVNQENLPNEGHGHLYVDGEKIARLYGNWYHISHLEPGTREVKVSLHANGHETWTYEGEAIAHTVTVNVPALDE